VSGKQTLVAQEDGDSTQPRCRLVHSEQPSSYCRTQHSVQDTKKNHFSLTGARIDSDGLLVTSRHL